MAGIPFAKGEIGDRQIRDFDGPINPFRGGPMWNYTHAQQLG
jgi:hypothetical protein